MPGPLPLDEPDGEADGLGLAGRGEVVGDADGGTGLAEEDGEGVGDGVGEREGFRERLGEADGVTEGEAEGDSVGSRSMEGCGVGMGSGSDGSGVLSGEGDACFLRGSLDGLRRIWDPKRASRSRRDFAKGFGGKVFCGGPVGKFWRGWAVGVRRKRRKKRGSTEWSVRCREREGRWTGIVTVGEVKERGPMLWGREIRIGCGGDEQIGMTK